MHPVTNTMNTITVPALDGRALEDRRRTILDIVADKKVVRFHYRRPNGQSFYKDVREFGPTEGVDVKSFRRGGGATEWVCWMSPELSIEEVEP